jgi:PGF-pre-PGF domain-containing protein
MTITKEEIGLVQISLEVRNLANNVKLTVTKLEKKPATLPNVTGIVYRYINISMENLPHANIKTARIKFKVTKSWIADNNIDEGKVILNRYTTRWDALPTTKVSEDVNFVHYEATTPGFSTFAITGQEKVPQICAPNTTKCVDNEVHQCNVDGTAWTIVETCEFGCSDGRCNPPPQICTPGDRRCSVDKEVQECAPNGTAWITIKVCEFDCFEGQCVPKPVSYPWLVVLLLIPVVGATAVYLVYKGVRRKKLIAIAKERGMYKPLLAKDEMCRYVKKCLEAGYSPANIRKVLLDAGWDSTTVKKAIDAALKERGE